MKRFHLFLLLLLPIFGYSQIVQDPLGGNDRNRENDPISNKNVKVEGEKPPITDYLIISQERDTTFLDTTLNMKKDYKFNYLRQDNFEYIPFHNIGQPYNKLSRSYEMDLLEPRMGARARHANYYEIDDVYDYYVPTPLTDLYFKTVVNQGQQLDALFTTNLSPQFNFSIGYKGLRSAGDYVNTLTSTGNFKFTSNYFTKDRRYRLRLHTTFQDLLNEENGGLDDVSLQGFLENDEDLDDRARLETNLTNAESLLDGKRFYVDQDYEILANRDSTSYYSARVYNKMYYEDKFYRFSQTAGNTVFFGERYSDGRINDQTDLEEGKVEVGATFDHYILGYFRAGLSRKKFNYGYSREIVIENQVIPNRLIGEIYQFDGSFEKRIGKFDFRADAGVNIAGDVDGQHVKAQAGYEVWESEVIAGVAINSRAPDFNYQLFQSDYVNYNWFTGFNNIEKQELYFKLDSEKFVDAEINLTTIQDQVFFEEEARLGTAMDTLGYNIRPRQAGSGIAHLKVKIHKQHKLIGHFGMDHTLMYQNVSQSDNAINVPSFVTRNTLYYKNRFFKRALQIQTGITFKYFSEYFMDGYDPILGEFYSQRRDELGAFPMIDLFVNAKVRQTRIFFKLEHANAPFGEQNYFSAPRNPYRDFTIRFGLVWNFFL
ncbi:MAG: putative porin [Nonlabens sp.]